MVQARVPDSPQVSKAEGFAPIDPVATDAGPIAMSALRWGRRAVLGCRASAWSVPTYRIGVPRNKEISAVMWVQRKLLHG